VVLTEGRYRWNGSQLVSAEGAPKLPLFVADSWLVNDGSVIAFERHLERFAFSCAAQGLVRSTDDFATAVTAALPRTGAWFPRIDLTERGELELWIRPAPARNSHLLLKTAEGDVRTTAAIKGPDIDALNALREEARQSGADDAIILTTSGQIIDGATTCLVWWRDGDLMMPPAEATRVDSVTVQVVAGLAQAHGIRVLEEWATPNDLEGTSVWALNALHGIRGVTSWVDGPVVDSESTMDLLLSWRATYDVLATPLDAV
jgi:branched-subunit amino acid aminotransferase/4-amino-4-deoxychorismate lyase